MKNIRCEWSNATSDGTSRAGFWIFGLEQFAGSLDCSGPSGVAKNFRTDHCERDRPPVLWSSGDDLGCCDGGCSGGEMPSASAAGTPAEIYHNGLRCGESSAGAGAGGSSGARGGTMAAATTTSGASSPGAYENDVSGAYGRERVLGLWSMVGYLVVGGV